MSDQSESSASLSFGDGNNFSGSRVSTGDIAGRDVVKHYHAAAERPIPAVSPPVADFIGRDQERQELGAVLRAGGAAIIRGMGGLGKTQLALRLAADVNRDFPDGQLMIELRGGSPERRSPEDALRAALWSLRGPAERLPDDLPGLVALFRATLGGRRLLVLVDDAPDSASARHFVPPAPCALLVTSRERISLDVQTRTLNLAALSDEQSRDLLLHLARRLDGDPLLPDLLRRSANLPLALRIVGDTLRERPDLPAGRYLARLADETRRLGALKHEDRDVYAIIGFSDTLLAERAPALAERWRMLHVCPAPFDREVVAALWEEQDEDALDDAIGELLRRSLLDYDEATERYNLHDLLRDIARQRCPEPAAEAAHERHARYFARLLSKCGALYRKGGAAILRALALFDDNLPHIISGQAWAAEQANTGSTIIEYALGAAQLLNFRLHPRTQIEWTEAARVAAKAADDKIHEGMALGNLGLAYADLGDIKQAIGYYEQDLALARMLADQKGEGAVLQNLGLAYMDLSNISRAKEFFEKSLELARTTGDRRGEGISLGNLGNAYRRLGYFAEAIASYQLRISLAHELGDWRGEAIALGSLGIIYSDLSNISQATKYYEQQLEMAKKLGDDRMKSAALGGLGIIYENSGEIDMAIRIYEEVLVLSRGLGDWRNESAALGNLGNIYMEKGELDKAIEFYDDVLLRAQMIGDRYRECKSLGNLGTIYLKMNQLTRAIRYYEQHLEISRSIDDRGGEATISWNLGLILEAQGEYDRAAELMQLLVDYERELSHPAAEQRAAYVEEVRRKAQADTGEES